MSVSTPLVDRDALAASAESVEPLPHTVVRLATLVADPNSDVREITEVVSLDVSLTADLLRRANSAALGGRSTITSVRDAVVRLGPSTLLSLTMTSRLGGRMIQALPAYGLQAGELWGHSVAASIAAEVVRSRSPRPIPAEAATAALLHDFGKIVLAKHLGNQILDTLALAAATDGMEIVEAERVVFGLTHAEIGGSVAEVWGLPLTIVDGIRDHHDAHEDLSTVSAAVGLACTMSFEITAQESTDEELERQTARRRAASPVLEGPAARLRATTTTSSRRSRRRFDEVAERYRA